MPARFVLRDNVLMYFASPKDFTGFRDKPSGIVLLEECNVRTRDDRASAQRFTSPSSCNCPTRRRSV